MPRWANHLTDVADVLVTSSTSGDVRVQVGNQATADGWANGLAMWGVWSVITRPKAPTAAGACQVVYLNDGNSKRGLASRDNRYASNAGTVDEGDTVIVTSGDAKVILDDSAQSVTLYAKNGGQDLTVKVDGGNDTVKLEANGATITITAAGDIEIWELPSRAIYLGFGSAMATPVAIMVAGTPTPSTKIFGVV